ncbi:chemotaxis protein CheW [Devosia sp. MC532]|nr:chemotaxis protein CheW [Devosia sp. MC532]MBK1795446.1 chemotaxis protein CheW [Devosia sp. WQ 349K1]
MKALTIRLGDEIFALEAERVREILEPVPVTIVPNAPEFARHLINFRGRVVPLTDLRVVFNMPRPPADQDTRVVVMELDIDGEPTILGVLADKVCDVTDIESKFIEDAPKVGMRWPAELVKSIGKRDGGFIIIPDLGRIFQSQGARIAPSAASEERLA